MAFTRTGTVSHAALSGVSAAQHHAATVTPAHPDPSVDNSIARYTGIAGALQGYTSLDPTFTDDGVLVIPAGAINFPDTNVPSADVNELDDIQEGTWIPQIADNNLDGTGESQSYGNQTGTFFKIGRWCYIQARFVITSLGTLTAGQQARIVNLPFTAVNTASRQAVINFADAEGLALPNGSEHVSGAISQNTTHIGLNNWDLTTGISILTLTEVSADGGFILGGWYEVEE